MTFLEQAGWGSARREAITGDASFRRYERLQLGERRAVLMDAPGFKEDPSRANESAYMQNAALAVNIAPFVAIDDWLRGLGLGAPEIFSCDIENGLLLLEDLGDLSFGHMVDAKDQRLEDAYDEAVKALVTLHRINIPDSLPVRGGGRHMLPSYHQKIMQRELEMLFEWYLPEHLATPLSSREVEAFWQAWNPLLFSQMEGLTPALLLRDYHTPNLHWRPERTGASRLGIIDFQDALIGSPAHDVMSLLQDARKDLPEGFEQRLLQNYLDARDMDEGFDAEAFLRSYAILGALRNTRLLGLWVRLPKRDGKMHYAAHLPRAWRHVEKNLSHPVMAEVQDWMNRVLPPDSRIREPGE